MVKTEYTPWMKKAIVRYRNGTKSNTTTVQGKGEVKVIIAESNDCAKGNGKKAIKTTLQGNSQSKKPYCRLK